MYLYVSDINFASIYIFTIVLFGGCYVVLIFLIQIILFNEWSYLHVVLILCRDVETLMPHIKPVVIYIVNTRPIGREKLKFEDISRKSKKERQHKSQTKQKGQLSTKHYTENYRSSSTNTTKNQGSVGFCGNRLFSFVMSLNIIRIPIYMFLPLNCRIANHNTVFVYNTKERRLVWYLNLIYVLFNCFNFYSRSNRIRTFASLHWNVILYFEHWAMLSCYSVFNQWQFDILKLFFIVAHEFKYINWTYFLLRCSCIFA